MKLLTTPLFNVKIKYSRPTDCRTFLLIIIFYSYKLLIILFLTVPKNDADFENDYLYLVHHVTYADIIICFHDTLYQLKYFGQHIRRQRSLTENLHMSLIR